jgi:hypothetical protein
MIWIIKITASISIGILLMEVGVSTAGSTAATIGVFSLLLWASFVTVFAGEVIVWAHERTTTNRSEIPHKREKESEERE